MVFIFQDCQGLGRCSECRHSFPEVFLDQYYLDRPCDFSSSGQPAAPASGGKSGIGVGTQNNTDSFHFKLE